MKTINARAMMEGAILAALTAIIGIFYNIPFMSIVTWFWPVPIIIVGYRNGFKVSMIAAFIAGVLVSLMATPYVGIVLFLTYAIPGAVMGYMLKKKSNPHMTLLVCGLLLAVTGMLQFILNLEFLLGRNIIDIVANLNASMSGLLNIMKQQTIEFAGVYKQYGINTIDIKAAMESIESVIQLFKLLWPTIFIILGMTLSFINYKAVRFILNRIGYKIEDIKKFSEWSLNKASMYVFLGITMSVLLLRISGTQFLSGLSTNIWILLEISYSVLGLSVIAYFKEKLGEKYKIPKPLQNLIFVIYALLMSGILSYVGMFDVAVDIRRFYRNIPGGAR